MKPLSPETIEFLLVDIQQQYMTGRMTQKELAKKYGTSIAHVRNYISSYLKEMSEKIKNQNEQREKTINSEEEVIKYGIPDHYKLKKI